MTERHAGSALPLGGVPELEQQVDRFEQAWQSGSPPRLEDFMPTDRLSGGENPERRELLRELVAVDLEYRWRRAGGDPNEVETLRERDGLPPRPCLENYVLRYPELGLLDQLPVALIGEEYRVRRQWGDRPDASEYLARFPWHAAALKEALPRLDVDLSGELARESETPPAAPRRGAPPPLLANYEILGELGRGGMGVVYKARDKRLSRLVALKMIRAGDEADPRELARFRREAEAVACLQHPNVVQVYEVGEQDGRPFFALELIAGRSLAQALAGTPQPANPAAQLVETLARAVHYAHQQGIIHRDLKPANVLLQRDEGGRMTEDSSDSSFILHPSSLPKITDFGLAKRINEETGHTRTGDILGTPSYMAPEQAAGRKDVGAAADTYALGAILYELLAGRPPFRGATVFDTLEQVQHQEPVPPRRLQPTVPRDLETICSKCLRKEPGKRYASAEALADDLGRFLAGKPILARPVGLWERGVKWARRRPAAAVAVVVSVLGALALVGLGAWSNAALRAAATREHHEAEAARHQRERATANFQLARDAVEKCYTQLSQDPSLRQPGLEPTRKELLQTVLQYYRKFVEERADDPDLQMDLARAYGRLGVITGQLGSPTEGIPYFHQALATWNQLSTLPDESELADLHTNLGHAYRAAGQMEEAKASFERAAAIWEALARDWPEVAAHRQGLAASCFNLGTWHYTLGQLPQAETLYTRALDLWKALDASNPADPRFQNGLANLHNHLGAFFRATGQWEKAKQSFEQARTLFGQLAETHPDAPEYRAGLAATYQNVGVLHLDSLYRDQLAGVKSPAGLSSFAKSKPAYRQSEEAFKKALELLDQLIRAHPAVTQYQKNQAVVHGNLSLLYGKFGTVAQAETAGRQALDRLEQFTRLYPQDFEVALALSRTCGYLGGVVKSRTKSPEALALLTRAVAVLEPFQRREPHNPEARRFLRDAHLARAVALIRLDRPKDTLPDWEQALDLDDRGEFRDFLLLQRAITLARTGQHVRATAEAKTLAAKPSATPADLYDLACTYALAAAAATDDPSVPAQRERLISQYGAGAVELLVKVRDAGYFDRKDEREHLQVDKDLDALRSRADFRVFLAEVGGRSR